jgi:TRAP-type uncharacterized transport system fused permease subunit
MLTAGVAMGLASAGFIVPFMFVYGPALLLQGSVLGVAAAVATATVGVVALAAAVIGHGRRPLAVWERLVMAGAAVALIFPGWLTDGLGLGTVALVLARGAPAPAPAVAAVAPQPGGR